MTSEVHAQSRSRVVNVARLIAEEMALDYQQARGWDISGYDLLEMRAELERRIAEARGSDE